MPKKWIVQECKQKDTQWKKWIKLQSETQRCVRCKDLKDRFVKPGKLKLSLGLNRFEMGSTARVNSTLELPIQVSLPEVIN